MQDDVRAAQDKHPSQTRNLRMPVLCLQEGISTPTWKTARSRRHRLLSKLCQNASKLLLLLTSSPFDEDVRSSARPHRTTSQHFPPSVTGQVRHWEGSSPGSHRGFGRGSEVTGQGVRKLTWSSWRSALGTSLRVAAVVAGLSAGQSHACRKRRGPAPGGVGRKQLSVAMVVGSSLCCDQSGTVCILRT